MDNIFIGYASLALSFVAFAFIFLLVLVKANNISYKFKLVMIPLLLCYSIVLYSTIQNFLGYPSTRVEELKSVFILSYSVEEGDAIYLWVKAYNRDNVFHRYFPNPPEGLKISAPIYVKIEYDSELYKKLVEAAARAERENKQLKTDGDRLMGFRTFSVNENPFELFDPMEVLRKEEAPESQESTQ